MLHVGCNCCGRVEPLWCAGSMWPHAPMWAVVSPFGPACPLCGPKPPIFTCHHCGTTQFILQPGHQVNATMMRQMGIRHVAPAVQANNSSSSPSLLQSLMKDALSSFVKSAGSSLGDQAADWAGGYFFDNQSY